MSKGIMIGKTEEEIHNKESSLELGDDFLGDVYVCIKPLQSQYPFLWKLVEDFYQKVFLSIAETKYLGDEIDRFLDSVPKISGDSIVWLNTLKYLCHEASQNGMVLFCVPD